MSRPVSANLPKFNEKNFTQRVAIPSNIEIINQKKNQALQQQRNQFVHQQYPSFVQSDQSTTHGRALISDTDSLRQLQIPTPTYGPCLVAQQGNPNLCIQCQEGYTLMLRNVTHTLCATIYNFDFGDGDIEQYCNISLTDYPNDYYLYNLIQTYANSYGYPIFSYFGPSPSGIPYCTDYSFYFYGEGDDPTNVDDGFYNCLNFWYPEQDIEIELVAIFAITFAYPGCYDCSADGWSTGTVLNYPSLGIQISACIANSTGCSYTQYLDPVKQKCVECKIKFPNCAACNLNTCLFCLENFYRNPAVYDYGTGNYRYMCIFDTCPIGYCKDVGTFTCTQSTIQNCTMCWLNSASSQTQTCQLCQAGFILSIDGSQCNPVTTTAILPMNYYYVQGGDMDTSQYSSPDPPDGLSPQTAFYYIQEAINQIYYDGSVAAVGNQIFNATVLLANAKHFFYFCNKLNSGIFGAKDAGNLKNYCSEGNQIKVYADNDNIAITFQPMDCAMIDILNPSNNQTFNTSFYLMCVNLSSGLGDMRPTIYINDNLAYFNISGSMTFVNLKFSGINQLAVPNQSTKLFTAIPIQLCDRGSYPQGYDGKIPLVKLNNSGFPFLYSCQDTAYQYSTIPPIGNNTMQCVKNQNNQFYANLESTLSCPGKFGDKFFFKSDPSSKTYFYRKRTLFNLYGFAQHQSIRNQTPQLNITNCVFQYFINNYESLINVETETYWKGSKAMRIFNQNFATGGGGGLFPQVQKDFYYTSGEDRGAIVTISNSIFQYSRFCKGLFVYRASYFEPTMQSLLNYTHIFMTTPNRLDGSSSISIINSKFQSINLANNVTALASYGGNNPLVTTSSNVLSPFSLPAFIHIGSVLNLEDFGGKIEIIGNNFDKNMLFIPAIQYRFQDPSAVGNMLSFYDLKTTQEYKMTICNQINLQDQYFFGSGFSYGDDVEQFYDTFERLSLIYISRNKDYTAIKDNIFTNNVGTFGGAISINSPNFAFGKLPYVAIRDNQFMNNMAYFSGNAIYIRSTMKKQNVSSSVCGGVFIVNNLFYYNSGLKLHNGGAVTAICKYLLNSYSDDFVATSSYAIQQNDNIYTSIYYLRLFSIKATIAIDKYKVSIKQNDFTQNYAGSKGTAIYIQQYSMILMDQNNFQQNGPVYAAIEALVSPYYKYLAQGLTVTFRDNNCTDEFNYLENCRNVSTQLLYWSTVQGVIYGSFCQQDYCLSQSTHIQQLYLSNSKFTLNEAGPIMDNSLFSQQINPTATQIYFAGGMNNTIFSCTFIQNAANSILYFPSLANSTLINFFPQAYFTSATSSLIVQVIQPIINSNFATFNLTITASTFQQNQNYQILGFTQNDYYQGQLIQYINLQTQALRYLPVLLITQCQFNQNQFIGPISGMINVQNALLMLIQNQFINNGYLSSIVQSYVVPSTIGSQDNYFTPYTLSMWQEQGMVQLTGNLLLAYPNLTHQFINNTYNFITSYQAAATSLVLNNQDAYFMGNQYQYIFSSQGGTILNYFGSYLRTTILMEREQYSFVFSLAKAAIVIAPQFPIASLIMRNSSFQNIYGSQNLAIYSSSSAKLYIQNVNFTVNPLQNGQTLNSNISNAFQGNLNSQIDQVYLSQFSSGNPSQQGLMYLEFTKNTYDLTFGGQIFQNLSSQYGAYSEILNCLFTNIQTQQYPVLSMLTSQVRMYNDIYRGLVLQSVGIQNNIAYDTGIMGITGNSQFIGQNIVFNSNLAYNLASAIFSASSNITLQNVTFINNICYGIGTLSLQSETTFLCQQCQFIGNQANDSSAIFFNSNKIATAVLQNSLFANNTAVTNLINMFQSSAIFNNDTFLDNTASLVNNGITMITSQIWMNNCIINHTNQTYLSQPMYTQDSGFFNLNYRSILTISNSTFINCRGAISAAIYATGSSSVNINPGTVFQNSISPTGDTIYASLAQIINVNGASFFNNTNTDMFIEQTFANIQNSLFQGTAKSSIYMSSSSVYLQNNTFQYSVSYNLDGKAIHCICQDATIINNTFQNLSAARGGALYMQSSNQNISSSYFNISGNIFQNNYAQFGGAVYFNDVVNASFLNNTLLYNNASIITPATPYTASFEQKGLGGGLYFACFNEILANLNIACYLGVGNNSFINNSAQNDGGAMLWVTNPYFDLGGNQYFNNSAFYGGNVASFPNQLLVQFLSNGDPSNPYQASPQPPGQSQSNQTTLLILRNLQSSTSTNQTPQVQTIPPLAPGVPFTFFVYILDQSGNIYVTDSTSKASLVDASPLQSSGNSLQRVAIFNGDVICQMGVYRFINVTVSAIPGTPVNLALNIAGVQTYGNNVSFMNTPLSFTVALRPCYLGESYLTDNSCKMCPPGTYLFFPPKTPTNCKDCSKYARCYGGSFVSPIPGYWRSSNTSENFIPCPNSPTCLGGNISQPVGICQTGYRGILCGECAPNWKSSAFFTCTMCPDPTMNIVQISLIGLIAVLVVSLMVKSTLSSATQQAPVHSVYTKILANHLQLIGAINNINFQWPSTIQNMQDTQGQASKSSDNAVSFDCFLMSGGGDPDNLPIPVYYTKLLIFGVLPFLMAFVDITFWFINCTINGRDYSQLRSKFTSTLVVLLFLIHPNIAQNMFLAFNCTLVDDLQRLKVNIQSVCYQGQHYFYMLVLIIPSVVLWAIGIPIFSAVLLFLNRKSIQLINKKIIKESEHKAIIQVKGKYGFLFQGYNATAYYWETIIMLRKIAVIMAGVFFSTLSPEMQVLIVFMIIVISMTLQVKVSPYYTDTLNQMEMYSMIVAGITLYTGLFYVTGTHYTYMQNDAVAWVFLVLLAAPNILFFLFWGTQMKYEITKMIYNMNKPTLFQCIACMRREQFYSKYLRADEEKAKANAQIIEPDFIEPPKEETLPSEEDPIQLRDINLAVQKRRKRQKAKVLEQAAAHDHKKNHHHDKKRKSKERRSKKYKIEIRDDQYSDDLDKRRGSENNDQYTKQFFEKDADESFTQMHLKSDQEINNPMKGIQKTGKKSKMHNKHYEDNSSENNQQSHRPLNTLMKNKRMPRFTSSEGNEESKSNQEQNLIQSEDQFDHLEQRTFGNKSSQKEQILRSKRYKMEDESPDVKSDNEDGQKGNILSPEKSPVKEESFDLAIQANRQAPQKQQSKKVLEIKALNDDDSMIDDEEEDERKSQNQ